MDNIKFTTAYKESRNGANHMVPYPLVRNFLYSDGVQSCADAGCHWLLDIIATELPQILRRGDEHMGCIAVVVKDDKAVLTMTGSGDVKLWTRTIPYTDMPEGRWMFYLCFDGTTSTLILPTEY